MKSLLRQSCSLKQGGIQDEDKSSSGRDSFNGGMRADSMRDGCFVS